MSRNLFGSALAAGMFAAVATVAAQNPPQTPPQTPPPNPTRTAPAPAPAAQGAVTVEGCVMREEDVPGRKPNVAEKAGIAEDYILTNIKMVKGTAPSAAPRAGEAVGTSGTRGASMFEIEGIDDTELKKHVGKRVQIDGSFENTDRAKAAPEAGTPADDLAEIRGTAIRQVSGDCK